MSASCTLTSGNFPCLLRLPQATRLCRERPSNDEYHTSAIAISALLSFRFFSLKIRNASGTYQGKIEASFWQALAENGVQIRYFAVYPLDIAAVRYFTSYEGLTELHIRGHCAIETRDCPDEVFHTVLSHHRQTLRKLTFSYLDFQSWSITDEYLECVLKCQALQSLTLFYHYPDDREWPLRPPPQEKLSPDMVSDLEPLP